MPDLTWWLEIKRQMVDLTTLERDAWHIYLGVAIQLATAAVLRWRLTEWRTLLPLVVLECANEAVDFFGEPWLTQRAMQATGAVHDLINTFVMPIVILFIARALQRSPHDQRSGGGE
ncbi:MAG: hypothetical protein V4659_02755 [Pseudomonadota bacterium]